jgi:hypothetical protein
MIFWQEITKPNNKHQWNCGVKSIQFLQGGVFVSCHLLFGALPQYPTAAVVSPDQPQGRQIVYYLALCLKNDLTLYI